jgi:anti-sigma factor RsiW
MSVGILHSVRDRMECMRVRPLLQPYLDGELDHAERQRFAAHLEGCRRCGLATSTYRTLKDRLRGLSEPAHPHVVARLEAFVDGLGG